MLGTRHQSTHSLKRTYKRATALYKRGLALPKLISYLLGDPGLRACITRAEQIEHIKVSPRLHLAQHRDRQRLICDE